MSDELLFTLVADDLAAMMGRTLPREASLRTAKELSFPSTAAEIGKLLDRFGVNVRRRNKLILDTLPALFASLVSAEQHLPQPPVDWRRKMVTAADRYVSAREAFSLNVMNIGLNLAQSALFAGCDLTGNVLDLGSGNGYVSNIILEAARARTVLSDVLPSALVEARRYGFRGVVGIDMHKLPYPDESFDTIVSVHSVDNAGQRERTLREAFRVLRPGGHLFFTDFLSNFLSARPLPRLLSSLSFRHLPAAYNDYAVRYSIDSVDRSGLGRDAYEAMLRSIGFEIERSQTFFGGLLFHYCYLSFDWELMLRDDSVWNYRKLHGAALAKLYREIAARSIIPLVHEDLRAEHEGQTQVFFHLRKRGQLQPSAVTPEPVCIRCRGVLSSEDAALVCRACGAAYPVVEGVPLLFAFAMDAVESARNARRGAQATARVVARRLRRMTK